VEIRIYYEDTDCGGVVYYANYLKYFERARTHHLEEHGLSVASLQQEGTWFLVTHAEVHYRSPARYGDVLQIQTTVSSARKASLTFHHRIIERHSARLVVEGSATLVPVNGQGKIIRLNPQIVQELVTS
jgi:acyl-CoA thioester hydrolase